MGLSPPDDTPGNDAAAIDVDARDASYTAPDAFHDRAFDGASDREERDVTARDGWRAADSAGEAADARDGAFDASRGSETGRDTPPHGGADSYVVVDVTGTRDAGIEDGVGDEVDANGPSDATVVDAHVDLLADVDLDIPVSDVGADDVADAGADRDGAVCGFAPPAPGGPCPAVCNDGCVDGICKIACRGEQECKEATVECPAGFSCEVNCAGKQSCESVLVVCPELYPCSLLCAGEQSCKELELNCRSGTCAIECLGNGQACDATLVNCGPEACAASCSGSEGRPTLNCGQSCDCRPCR
jgi:hypothetical protein